MKVYQIHTRYADGEGYLEGVPLPIHATLEGAQAGAQELADDDFDDLDDDMEPPRLIWTHEFDDVWAADFGDVVYTITETELLS